MSVKEAAAYWEVAANTMRKFIRAGAIKARRSPGVRGNLKLARDDVLALYR